MHQRIADQIRGDLSQPLAVPLPRQVALLNDLDGPLWIRRLLFLHDAVDENAEIRLDPGDRNAAGQARPRQVEQVFDHPRHPAPARQHTGGNALHRFVGGLMLQQLRAGDDGGERGAEIVAEDRGEHFVEMKGFGPILKLLQQLLPLAMELEEHVRLVLQDQRLDRLVEEVDRSGVVALEHPMPARDRRR